MITLLMKFDKKLSFFLSILQIGIKLDIKNKKIYTTWSNKKGTFWCKKIRKRGYYEFK